MRRTSTFFILIVLFQVSIIFFISFGIYHKNKQKTVLGAKTAQVMQKDDYIIARNDSLLYFYEPEPNKNIVDHPSWLDYDATYTINADSLNDIAEYKILKEASTFRIVTLGDSFTYGAYVDTENNWTEKLENSLNVSGNCPNIQKYEVINLGVGGYDLEYEINRFILRGIKYDPDLIIIFTKDDDFEIINELLFPIEMEMRDKLEVTPEDNKYYYDNGAYYPTWTQAMKKLKEDYGEDFIMDYQQRQLEKFKDSYNNRLLVVSPWLKPEYENLIKKVFGNSSYVFIHKLTDVFDKDLVLFDGHPSVKGHEEIAMQIYQYMIEGKLMCK